MMPGKRVVFLAGGDDWEFRRFERREVERVEGRPRGGAWGSIVLLRGEAAALELVGWGVATGEEMDSSPDEEVSRWDMVKQCQTSEPDAD